MGEESLPLQCEPKESKELESLFAGSRAQVYCTNGSRLAGAIHSMPGKWIQVEKDPQRSALVNLEYVISIALEKEFETA